MKKIINNLNVVLLRLLSRRLYCFLWAPYACAVNCYTMMFKQGMYRSARIGGSVDRHGNPMPWLTYPAIEYLKRRDFSGMDVFEFGSGYSTAYFSSHARSVTAAEHQVEWRDKVLAMCKGRNNVEIIVAGNEKDYLATIDSKGGGYDIIVVDGEWRLACMKAAIKKLRPGGIIILDDAETYMAAVEYLEPCGMLRVDFWGFAPYIHYSKNTCMFFDKRSRMVK